MTCTHQTHKAPATKAKCETHQRIKQQDATITALVEALEEFIPADSTAHAYDKARAALMAAKEGAK